MIKNFEEIAFVIDIKSPLFFTWRSGDHSEQYRLLSLYINKVGCEVGFLCLDIKKNQILSVDFGMYEEFINEGNTLKGF